MAIDFLIEPGKLANILEGDLSDLAAKTPEQIATEIVDRFSWSSNVLHQGKFVGQQYVVAIAIAEAIRAERERCAAIPQETARRLICGGRRTNQVDRHVADVLARTAEEIRSNPKVPAQPVGRPA